MNEDNINKTIQENTGADTDSTAKHAVEDSGIPEGQINFTLKSAEAEASGAAASGETAANREPAGGTTQQTVQQAAYTQQTASPRQDAQQTSYTQYGAQTQQNWQGTPRNAYRSAGQPQQQMQYRNPGSTKTKKPMSTGKKWVLTVCMALVFGLVAGVVMFGVNSIGNRITDAGRISSEAGSPEKENEKKTETQKAGTQKAASQENGGSSSAGAVSTTTGLGSVEAVVEECMPSVVTIATVSVQEMQSIFGGRQEYQAEGAGTGVIVGQNDTELLIATNNHVVLDATSVSVGFIDESTCEAKVKGTDMQHDLAVIAVNTEDISEETMSRIKVAVLGNSDDLRLGEQVVVIGNALGEGQSVFSGCISGLGRELQLSDGKNNFTSSDLIQTDASINPGNSGGALLNMKGELVGINEAKASYATNGATVDNVGYAIPISKAEPILEDLMNLETRDKAVEGEEGYLGVTCKDITSDSDLVTVYGFPEGVCFLEVLEGGPAAEAGLQRGDVLTKFDGRSIGSYDDLKSVMQYYSAGEEVELTVLRQSDIGGEYEEITKTVKLCDYSTLENIYSAE